MGEIEQCAGMGAIVRPAGPGHVEIEAWFEQRNSAARCLERWSRIGGCRKTSRADDQCIESITDPGWLDASLAPRPPIHAGRFIIAGRESDFPLGPSGGDRQHILLPAGRAFGTGEHATTRLCLEALDRHYVAPGKVLDLGTGSAILAIAAAMAGAEHVLAVDRDPMVLDVAQENLHLNGVQDKVTILRGSWGEVPEAERFAMILANIHKSALTRGARALVRMLEPGGNVIVSGFLQEDAEAVVSAWEECGARLEKARRDGEWAALVFVGSEPPARGE